MPETLLCAYRPLKSFKLFKFKLMTKLFGTDGMRGEAGRFPLDAETVRLVGHALATELTIQLQRPPHIIVGRDTRESSIWIERQLIDGVRSVNATCESAGVIPTPGVAYLARTLPADAGVVISASHNPYKDNGIKIFAPSGRKLNDATERQIEAAIHAGTTETGVGFNSNTEAEAAKVENDREEKSAHLLALQGRYINYLAEQVAGDLDLSGLRMVVDAANGAASAYASALFAKLGAQIVSINDCPDGRNINLDCGSLHLDVLQRKVLSEKASFGVAFDGDADRALFVDERGEVVDGDQTLWVLTQWFAAQGALTPNLVVATVMSNLGLEVALRRRGIELRRTNVGDKYVLEELLKTGAALGGEQSGHVIFPRLSLAGDGMMTTLLVLRAIAESNFKLSELTRDFVRYPQVLVNVYVREKQPFDQVTEIKVCAEDIQQQLGSNGRLLLRYSGTEPLARVMIEGQTQSEIEDLAKKLAAVIEQSLGR